MDQSRVPAPEAGDRAAAHALMALVDGHAARVATNRLRAWDSWNTFFAGSAW